MKILNIYFPRVRMESIIRRVNSPPAMLVPLHHDWPHLTRFSSYSENIHIKAVVGLIRRPITGNWRQRLEVKIILR